MTFEFEVIGNDDRPLPVSGMKPARRIDQGPTGPWGWFFMVVFWAIMGGLAFGFGWGTLALLLAYLALTGLALWGIAVATDRPFGHLVGNNDWVFWTNTAMGILSLIVMFFDGPWIFGDIALLSAIGFLPSIAVSFWDEAKVVLGGTLTKHGLGGFLRHVFSWEILEELLKLPFGGGNK